MISSFISFLNKLTTPRITAEENELSYWRERMLLFLLLIAVVVGFFAYLSGLPHFIRHGMWEIIFVDTVVYGFIIIMFICKNLPFSVRAGFSILVLYTLGIYLLYRFGLYGPGFIWLFAFPVMVLVFSICSEQTYTLRCVLINNI